MSAPTAARIAKLRGRLAAADLPAAAFVPGPNFYYLTGVHLHLMERPTILIVPVEGPLWALMPALERDRWSVEMPEARTYYWQDSDGWSEALAALARDSRIDQLAVDAIRMRHFEAAALTQAFGFEMADATPAIAALRAVKDPAEVATITAAIQVTEAALEHVIAKVAVGMSETEIRAEVSMALLANGADGTAFDPIVLAGAAASDCHGIPSSNRRLERGDALVLDFGALVGGYAADITRTFFCQTVSDAHRDIYEAVREANAIGLATAAPGVTFDVLDRKVRSVLEDAGYADLIRHKTGHGLGLDVHEPPQVMIGNDQAMVEADLFTIEPGLYRPDDLGVRIEDDVLVTASGARSLSSFRRDLVLVG